MVGRYGLPESFVIPGAGTDSATAHVARAVCRRCERVIVALNGREPVSEYILAYINRLADMLFVLAWALEVRDVIRRVLTETLVAGKGGGRP